MKTIARLIALTVTLGLILTLLIADAEAFRVLVWTKVMAFTLAGGLALAMRRWTRVDPAFRAWDQSCRRIERRR